MLFCLASQWALSSGHQQEASACSSSSSESNSSAAWWNRTGTGARRKESQGGDNSSVILRPTALWQEVTPHRERPFTFAAEWEMKQSEANRKSRPTSSVRSICLNATWGEMTEQLWVKVNTSELYCNVQSHLLLSLFLVRINPQQWNNEHFWDLHLKSRFNEITSSWTRPQAAGD